MILFFVLTLVYLSTADGHSLTFSGSGYVKYRLMENDNKELMKLSLRLRTFSTHATVMYAKGTDYSILEVSVNLLFHPFTQKLFGLCICEDLMIRYIS